MLTAEVVMTGKYEPLAHHLRAAAADGQTQVTLSFGSMDRLVGGLPPSARRQRTWWGNSSHGQALAWMAAGWHVSSVDLPGALVVFATGQVGGSYADRGYVPATERHRRAPTTDEMPTLDEVDVRVRLTWRDAGTTQLDAAGKLTFPPVPNAPGLYRLTLTGRPDQHRRRVYIGESSSLPRRLNTNYRNPGPTQQTSLRVNALLIEHLRAGGTVALAVSTASSLSAGPGVSQVTDQPLDLTHQASRRLAENAALVLARITDDADIENLG
jgi:hypothetical protein